MSYTILKKFELSEKLIVSLNELEKNKKLVLSLPRVGGIYVVLVNKEFERLRDKFDILYIGRTCNLQRRIIYLWQDQFAY